jgi:hypothetical protein
MLKKDFILEWTISGNLKYNRVHTKKLITFQIQKKKKKLLTKENKMALKWLALFECQNKI